MRNKSRIKPVSLFWWKRDKGRSRNFGDDMSPLLLEYATGRPVRFEKPKRADVIGVGSILQLLCSTDKARRMLAYRVATLRRFRPVVWGSGMTGMDADGKQPVSALPAWHLDLRVLRGPHSARIMRQRAGQGVYGDPALLCARVWPAPATKTYEVGIVPHYTDMQSPALALLKERFPKAKIISVENEATQVVREIASCEAILSSSMHGLIVADSYGIPNHRLVLEGQLTGGDFKFLDYAAAIGRPDIAPVVITSEVDLFAGDFAYQAGIDAMAGTLVRAISDLAV